jgi:hypothetical protein
MPKTTQSTRSQRNPKAKSGPKALAMLTEQSTVESLLNLASDMRFAATEVDAKASQAAAENKPALWAIADELRWQAQDIYTESAQLVVSEVAPFVTEVAGLVSDARSVIKKIDQAKIIVEIVGDLVHVAASISARKVGPLKVWLKELKSDLKQYRES